MTGAPSAAANAIASVYVIERTTGRARRATLRDASPYLAQLLDKPRGKTYVIRHGRLRNISFSTVQLINNLASIPSKVVQEGVKKLQRDAHRFDGFFPQSYYAEFSIALFESALRDHPQDPDGAVKLTYDYFGVNVETVPVVLPAFQIYEAIASSASAAFDKVQHFVACAYLQYSRGEIEASLHKYGKEVRDEIKQRIWNQGNGYDHGDIRADEEGQNYGAQLYARYHPLRDKLRIGR